MYMFITLKFVLCTCMYSAEISVVFLEIWLFVSCLLALLYLLYYNLTILTFKFFVKCGIKVVEGDGFHHFFL